MRKAVRRFAEVVSQTLPIMEPIYEFGACQVPGSEKVADIRSLFKQREYYGCDIAEGAGVDRIMDIQDIHLPDETVGAVLCFETLEHVQHPWIAMQEVHRILKPGGMVVLSVPMNLLLHAYPADYWRFTTQGVRILLTPFENSWVGYGGVRDFPHTVVGIGFKGASPEMADFVQGYRYWQSHQPLSDVITQFLPVGLIPPFRWASRVVKRLIRPSLINPDLYRDLEGPGSPANGFDVK